MAVQGREYYKDQRTYKKKLLKNEKCRIEWLEGRKREKTRRWSSTDVALPSQTLLVWFWPQQREKGTETSTKVVVDCISVEPPDLKVRKLNGLAF
jgi:hypothetical protein